MLCHKSEQPLNGHMSLSEKRIIHETKSYFLFLLSTAGFLISFFAIADPGGMPYGIGERAWADDAVTGTFVGGTGGRAGTGGWDGVEAATGGAGVALESGSDLGKMCFNRLFL